MKFCIATLALFAIPPLFGQATPAPKAPAVTAPPAPAAVPSSNPDKVVLAVGNMKITAAQYEQIVNTLPAQYQTYAKGAGKRAFAEQIVQVKLLSQEAEKRKLDQQPKVQQDLAFQHDNLLAAAMFQSLQDSAKVDDASVEKYYNEHKTEYETVKARHVLIRAKGAPMQAAAGKPELSDAEALAKAQELRKRIAGGEDFAVVAKAESDDTGSAAQGGELGEFRRGMMVPPFEEAAFAAKVGELTEPVKSPFGYHVIKVESHSTKTLADAKSDIEKKIRPDIAKETIAAMRKTAAVQLDDSFFGPAEPAGPAPAAAAPTAPK